MAVCQRLARLSMELPILFAGDMTGVRMSRAGAMSAKLQGRTAGEADIRVYLPGGKLAHVELKTGKGRLSEVQKERHRRLKELGHTVEVIQESDPYTGADTIERLVRAWVAEQMQ